MDRGIAAKLCLALVCAILLLKCKMSLAVYDWPVFEEEERVATEEEIALWDRLNKPGLPLSEYKSILTGVEKPRRTRIGGLTVQQVLDYKEMRLEKCQADKWEELDVDKVAQKSIKYSEMDVTAEAVVNAGVKTFVEHYRKKMAQWCSEHIREVVRDVIWWLGGRETLKFLQEKFEHVTSEPYDLELSARCWAVNKYLRVTDENFYGVWSQSVEYLLTRDWINMKARCAELIPSIDFWDKLNNLPALDVDSTLTAVPNKDKTWIGELTVQQVLDYKELRLEKCQADKWAENDALLFSAKAGRAIWMNGYLEYRQNTGVRTFAEHYRKEMAKWCREHILDVVQAAVERVGGDKTVKFLEDQLTGFRAIDQQAKAGCVHFDRLLKVTDKDFYGERLDSMDAVLTDSLRSVKDGCRKLLISVKRQCDTFRAYESFLNIYHSYVPQLD